MHPKAKEGIPQGYRVLTDDEQVVYGDLYCNLAGSTTSTDIKLWSTCNSSIGQSTGAKTYAIIRKEDPIQKGNKMATCKWANKIEPSSIPPCYRILNDDEQILPTDLYCTLSGDAAVSTDLTEWKSCRDRTEYTAGKLQYPIIRRLQAESILKMAVKEENCVVFYRGESIGKWAELVELNLIKDTNADVWVVVEHHFFSDRDAMRSSNFSENTSATFDDAYLLFVQKVGNYVLHNDFILLPGKRACLVELLLDGKIKKSDAMPCERKMKV